MDAWGSSAASSLSASARKPTASPLCAKLKSSTARRPEWLELEWQAPMTEHKLRELHDLFGRAIRDLQGSTSTWDSDSSLSRSSQPVKPCHVQALRDVALHVMLWPPLTVCVRTPSSTGSSPAPLVDQDVLVAQRLLPIGA